MKANRLAFTVLLSVAVFQLAPQQTEADQKPLEEVKAEAEAGDAESEVQLGFRYAEGEGVVKDQVEAVKWYRKAAEQNDATAQLNMGYCYYNGEGAARDHVEAVRWFRKAAEQNYAPAQYFLGVCYASGEGVAKDDVEAYNLTLLAAGQGIKEAKHNMTILENRMTREQIAEGQ